MILYYIHDPMCSWCWAFRPTLQKVLDKLPESIIIKYVLGGLAPDSQTTMDIATQKMIQYHWRTIIQRVPGTQFNFDFWSTNTPKRSTYPACRAVLAATAQDASKEDDMIQSIQQAYYLNAKNPSDDETLISCAESIGLNTYQFQNDLHAPYTQALLQKDIQQAQALHVTGFPSLVLSNKGQHKSIIIDYNDAGAIYAQLVREA